jgi:hypothetical protein
MATTTNPTKTHTNGSGTSRGTKSVVPAGPRVRGSARTGRIGTPVDKRDRQYDLLTAAMLGAFVGAGAALLLRRGPGGSRPIEPAWRAARAGAKMAKRASRFAWDRGVDAWDKIPREEIADNIRDYAESARESIDEFVHSELDDLRRAIRRRRKKLGI